MDVKSVKNVHLIGAGGINMSAVAKLLLAQGVTVSGSDVEANEQTKMLEAKGARIVIGEAPEHIPQDTQLIIYTSAAGAMNKERIEGARRKIPELNNFAFLGQWFADAKTIVVTGTHGKSTTTAMLGLILEKAGMDPTVVVGSKVPTFPDGNVRMGKSDLFVVEGDEYARHFLEFHPHGVILNNLELDHVDVFRNVEMLLDAFHEMVEQVQDNGVVVANVADERIARLIETEEASLTARGVKVMKFSNVGAHGDAPSDWVVSSSPKDEHREMTMTDGKASHAFSLSVPGEFNAMNAAGASLMAMELGVNVEDIASALQNFKGIWRRFEYLGEVHDALVYSDYGHHPTAVAATLKAAHEMFPGRKIVLCFQPHHRNRTKSLFLEFVPSFDEADALVLCEIYDVAGRDAAEDQSISSKDVVEAVVSHDADRGAARTVEYAPDPVSAVKRAFELATAHDVVICMGAGDIDNAVRSALKK